MKLLALKYKVCFFFNLNFLNTHNCFLVPPTVLRCIAFPVYDYFSNNLKRIEIEWDPIKVGCISMVRSLNVKHFLIYRI